MAVGDVVGTAGLDMLSRHLRSLQKLRQVSFTVVNGENASGVGLTPRQAEDIFAAGADVITLGNHSFSRKEILNYLDDNRYILRPANFAPQVPGRGYGLYETAFGTVLVMNLIGRCTMDFGPDNPFFTADRILKENPGYITLVDMHAEATSEKLAMARYLDGRAAAVWGTHTHVQTSDATVSAAGTGYITDLGMTGAVDSILGIKPEQAVSRFLGDPPSRFEAQTGPAKLECALFTMDSATGRCTQAEALRLTD